MPPSEARDLSPAPPPLFPPKSFQLAGEIIARLFGLPLPGPVLGMVLLVAAMSVRPTLAEKLGSLVDGLLANSRACSSCPPGSAYRCIWVCCGRNGCPSWWR